MRSMGDEAANNRSYDESAPCDVVRDPYQADAFDALKAVDVIATECLRPGPAQNPKE
jgi:hypothetical protein